MGTHVIIGSGAVGSGAALELANQGHEVKLVTRSGSGPEHAAVARIAADASDVEQLTANATGADAIYNCANFPYHRWAEMWPPMSQALIAAASLTGARLVTMSNLYGYAAGSSPMRESDPLDPPSENGRIRAAMWTEALAAQDAGKIQATEARASDFIGPGIGETAHMGDRVVPRILAGKTISVVGDPNQPHSWTAIGDVATTLAELGTADGVTGAPWHVPTGPPMTATEVINRIADLAGVERVKVKGLPTVALTAAGVFSGPIRAMKTMLYQFNEPFIMDSSHTEQTLGLSPTPFDETLVAAIESYRTGAPTHA